MIVVPTPKPNPTCLEHARQDYEVLLAHRLHAALLEPAPT